MSRLSNLQNALIKLDELHVLLLDVFPHPVAYGWESEYEVRSLERLLKKELAEVEEIKLVDFVQGNPIGK